MFAKVNVVSVALLVASLEVACHEHRQKERADATMVGLIELATLQEAFEDDEEWAQFGELNQQLSD